MKPIHYPYLDDKKFLKEFDLFRNKEQFVKIVVLSWKEEKVIAEIQGRATGGSINVNGKSSVRRTASINIVADDDTYNIMDVRNLISINKKIEIEVGFSNFTEKYVEYPILWFPQGVYVTQDASIKEDTSGISISLQLQDKMCMLNGFCGGTFGAGVTFDSYIQDGATIPVPIYTIIKRAVQEYGGEDPTRIIINDIENRIKKVMRWIGDRPVYLIKNNDAANHSFYYLKAEQDYIEEKTYVYGDTVNEHNYYKDKSLIEPITKNEIESAIQEENSKITVYFLNITDSIYKTYVYGDDIGYVYDDFHYDGQLVCTAGENVVTVLEKIKNALGNYEYFYDLYGNFIFQEIRNYLNTTQATFDLNQGLSVDQYMINFSKGKSVYTFEDGSLISAYSCNPQYSNIKNDFVIWGQRNESDTTKAGNPIHYHLAIDTKPKTGNYYFVIMKKADISEDATLMRAEPIPTPIPITEEKFKEYSSRDPATWYYVTQTSEDSDNKIYKIGYYHYINGGWVLVDDEDAPKIVQTHDWREELYFKGMLERQKNIYNFYNEEMAAFWPLVFDEIAEIDKKMDASNYTGFTGLPVYKGKYKVADPRDIDFYIDFIDTTGPISDFHVDNIGRRTYVENESSINCLFAPEVPNFVLIKVKKIDSESEEESEEVKKLRKECEDQGQPYIQISGETYEAIAMGHYFNPAYEYIRNILYQFLTYNETVSISTIPIYYLEANTRITIANKNLGINGDYMIDSYSLPLDTNGTMNITCSKALERI